jgi:mannosyltransferase OCH1-like enzyme
VTNLFQILISDEPQDAALPPLIARYVKALKGLYPDHAYRRLQGEEIRTMLAEHLPPQILRAYDCLNPYSYKADLARYALLYLFGGWYYDLGVRAVTPIAVQEHVRLIGFADSHRHSRAAWPMATSIIYAEKGHPALKIALDLVVENCRSKNYGMTALCPTGPTLFGRAVAMHGKTEEYFLGEFRALTPDLEVQNRAYLLPQGQIVAFAKPAAAGDVAFLGLKGGNNYKSLWRERAVYGDF